MSLEDLYDLFLKHPEICTDTRKLKPGCIYFALKGEHFNGNLFAGKALESGAAFAVVDEATAVVSDRCMLVSNVLETLQGLARHHRLQLNIPLLAIVGSNGKTTTKELLGSVLDQKFKVLCTPGNFNNHIGLPLTLLMLDKSHEIAVIEMGANHEKENAMLCEIACPTHGLVTNNGKDHLEGFGSMEGVIQSNSELFIYLAQHNGIAFVNANDSILMEKSGQVKTRVLYAQASPESVRKNEVRLMPSTLQPEITFQLGDTPIKSVLSGDYNFDNILAAVTVGLHFGLLEDEIRKGVELYRPQNIRSQLLETPYNKVFLDAYNANPSSMELSIRNFAAMPGFHKWAILGDMFELGPYEEAEHQLLVDQLMNTGFEQIFLVGPAFQKTKTSLQKFPDTQTLLNFIQLQPIRGKFIFIKGSRGMKLENLMEFL